MALIYLTKASLFSDKVCGTSQTHTPKNRQDIEAPLSTIYTLVQRSNLKWDLFQMSALITADLYRLALIFAISERFNLKSVVKRVWVCIF